MHRHACMAHGSVSPRSESSIPHPFRIQETILSLKKKLHSERKKLSVERQRLTLHPKAGEARGQVLEDDKKISEYGLKDGDSLLIKDLGPQEWGTLS